MTSYQKQLLSQTTDFEIMAGIIFMDLHEENLEAWELVEGLDIKTYLPIEARPILEKLAKEIINLKK